MMFCWVIEVHLRIKRLFMLMLVGTAKKYLQQCRQTAVVTHNIGVPFICTASEGGAF